MSDALLVHLSFPTLESARQCCDALVREGLAACAQIHPLVTSVYQWKGTLCEDTEATVTLKTRRARFDELRERVVEMHSYECPEIVATPIIEGHPPYLEWIEEMTQPPSEP